MLNEFQKAGMALTANDLPDPGDGGVIRVPADMSGARLVFNTTGATLRTLKNGSTRGQQLFLINKTGSAVTVSDEATTLTLEIGDNEIAFCVYLGESDAGWVATLLKSGSVS